MARRKVEIKCPICESFFERFPGAIKRAVKKTGVWRCKKCTLTIKNKASARTLMSRRQDKDYVKIKTNDGWMCEHRYVVEQYLGRKLEVNESVHHKNHIRNDNRLENLEIMDHGEHTKMHHTGLKRSDETRKRIRESKKRSRIWQV